MKTITKILLASLLFVLLVPACRQKVTAPDDYVMAFYNLENLFDTIDDPSIRDEEFLPDSKTPWNTERYQKKLENMSNVIAALDSNQPVPIVGLCEVENKTVLHDLVNTPKLKPADYSIIHYNSPDERGIDVAMLYRDQFFTPLQSEPISVDFPFDTDNKTRDILYVKGMIAKDTFHLFVNHWTSRWGGRKETDPHRAYIAEILKGITDSLFRIEESANIVIMGDLNDNPNDRSVADVLNAKMAEKNVRPKQLYNLSYNKFLEGEGTLYWKSWDMFDQIIVSSNLLKNKRMPYVSPKEQFIFKPDWIMFKPEEGKARPNRTKGRNYYGGYSDHLPVYIRLVVK